MISKERCLNEALKYSTRNNYQRKSKSSYNIALKYGWLNDICSHMIELRKPKNYHTFKICLDLANGCKTRKEFSIKHVSTYRTARINKWLDEICQHMKQF